MVKDFEKAGRGGSTVGVLMVNFNSAVDLWRRASSERKGELAAAVLSNLGEVGGTLEDRVGQVDAKEIRADYRDSLSPS